jgi:uncharacterized membrane protein YuzA (DUF378 family)
MSSSEQLTLMYYKKLAFKVAMVLLIVGGLNWLLVGAFKWNLVKALLGEGTIARTIYVLVGVAALAVMFDRDSYLPFLGPTVIPCSSVPDRTPPGASKTVTVSAPPGSKVLYWAAEPEMEALKQVQTWKEAYAGYENAGVTTADTNGQAILKVRAPQAYTVPFRGRLPPHVHFRICESSGMLGRVKTVFLEDGRVEGFSSF